MDPYCYRVFHQMSRGHTTLQSHRRSCGKFHQRKHNFPIWDTSQNHKRQWYTLWNKEVKKMLEFYQVKHHRSLPYRQGNGLAEATNTTLIKIISKMSQEYNGGWVTHLLDTLWAYQSLPKSATRFSPFSLVYGIEVVSLAELMIPSLRVMQM